MCICLFVLLSGLLAFAGTPLKPTTTLTTETSNNTSAAASFVSQTNGNTGGANISKMPSRTLLYPGATTKIYAHFLPWFGFGDHMNVGYVSSDTLQVQKQVADMLSRGMDGTIIDWYGRGTFNAHFISYDHAAQSLMHEAELHPGFSFAIMADAGALKTCSLTAGCDVTQTLIDDLNYVNVTYANSPAYLHFSARPVIYFFGHEAYAIDWGRVRAGVAGNPLFIFRNSVGFSYAQSGGAFSWVAPENVTATNLMSLNYLDNYFQKALTLPVTYSNGSGYKGFDDSLASWGTGRLIGQQCGQTWLQSVAEAGKFYSSTNQLLATQLVTWNDYEEGTEIETGIDNCVTVAGSASGTVVSWTINGQENTIDHFTIFVSQDGENLMPLADLPASARSYNVGPLGLSAGNYTAFVKAVGKPSLTNKMSAAIAFSIANQPPSAALVVTPLSGTGPLTVSASTAGSTDADGSIASSSINFGDGSAPVVSASATHIYSAAGTYTVTGTVTDNLGATATKTATVVISGINQPPVAALSLSTTLAYAPAAVTASTAGSTDADGTIATSTIDFGDGTIMSGPTAAHAYAAAGTYNVTAKVTDNGGASSATSKSVTVKAPEMIVTSPVDGGTVSSLVHFVGSGHSGNTVTTSQIYLDFKLVYQVGSPNLDTTMSIAPGTHTVELKGWDNTAKSFAKALNITVVDAPPVAVLGLSSASIIVGGSITASSAGSKDTDGNVAATKIDFGDGTIVAVGTASHQYKVAGTYTVKLTVTDNFGVSSSTTKTVTVKPQFTVITSPAAGPLSVGSVQVSGQSFSGYSVTSTQVYLDGVLKYQSPNNTANTFLTIGTGTHSICIQGWDSSGATFKTTIMVTR